MFKWKEKITFKGDKVLWYVIIMLMIVSVMVVYSSTGRLAYNERGGNTMFYLLKQLFLIGGCFAVMFVVQSIHYRYFSRYAGWLLLIAGGLLLYAAVGGTNINGAGRWIRIPVIGLTFQPSELAKIAILMYVARILTFGQTDRFCEDTVLEQFWRPGLVILLIFHDNISTALLICLVCFLLLVIARVRWKLLGKIVLIVFCVGGIGIGTLVSISQETLEKKTEGVPFLKRLPTARNRIVSFFSGKEGNDDYMYQSVQAKIAVAKGGLMGCGPGNSSQRNFLPHPYSDFIYAIVIEEYGWIGGGFIMLLYLIILFRVGVIVRRCTRIYPALLVTGLGLVIVLQAMVHMGVCVGLFPVTGQTLPLVSMGGTSLLFTSASFGIILSISHTFSEEGEREEQDTETEEEEKEEVTEENLEDPEKQMEESVGETEDLPMPGRRRSRKEIREEIGTEEVVPEQIEMEEELQEEGRQILKELNRRGRRSFEREG